MGMNFAWFRSYLTNKIQYISITHALQTDTKNMCRGFSQGSILGPSLFLLYVNDVHNSSALDSMTVTDNTNLYYEHKDFKTLSSLISLVLQKINEWFEANKLFLNIGKTKYSPFHEPSRKDHLPLSLPIIC